MLKQVGHMITSKLLSNTDESESPKVVDLEKLIKLSIFAY